MRRQDKIRELIDEKLRALHLHRKDLVPVLNISASAITRKMQGTTPFTDVEVQALSDFLQIPDLLAYPAKLGVKKPGYAPYHPAVKVIDEGLSLLSVRDQGEIYFVVALLLELKSPSTNHGQILRALATQP
jgi:hypothetical protein